ncbi:MAG: envelope stress response membrane protein PspB [Pseudomonadales bacterium]|nr:envelope stress response membrane protein PspB [Pseudomonadales bacterium]NRA17005.1 envelope stress response membrane protein PspB [Oceanospirillaceae bacterium]
MSGMVVIFVPIVVFLVIVAPLWLILHYWSRNKEKKGLSEEDQDVIEEVAQTIEKLSGRINNLEAILDDQHKGWRNHNH